jgi:hypothetical protein
MGTNMTYSPEVFEAPHARMPSFEPGPAEHLFGELLLEDLQRPEGKFSRALETFTSTCFPQEGVRVAVVLYAPGQPRLLVSREGGGKKGLERALQRLVKHPRYSALAGHKKVRLQLDFVADPPTPMDLGKVGMTLRGDRHFEVGLEGIELRTNAGKRHLFLPGDAFVYSIMSLQQLRAHLRSSFGSETVAQAHCARFHSESYLWIDGHFHRLYRGMPLIGPLTREKLSEALMLAVDHVLREQNLDGTYLYYYDAATDSRRDHEHPTRDPETNPYYNILRHSGGALNCLYSDQLRGERRSYDSARRAIEFLIAQARTYATDTGEAAYIYSERKAKLGGTGLGLYLLAEYEITTGDTRYHPWAQRLARHLIQQITASGEFIYYNIYLDENIDERRNANYFSFYYPGEAICGLARYLHLIGETERTPYFNHLHRALHYLINIRPTERADQYTNVPSDAWLMMGIKELWDFPAMRKADYFNFVVSDARQMVAQMYKVDTAPYPDYAGGFYYRFGDYPYSDGARMEGLMGAYQLALKAGQMDIAQEIWPALCLGAWATLHLVNTPAAVYSARNPARSLGGIRFKYTRQWFRIDTIQHVASFYARLLGHWPGPEA